MRFTAIEKRYKQGDKMEQQAVKKLWNVQNARVVYPTEGITTADRIKGAIMGALIGDALGVGCHWYTEYESFWKDHSTWVANYVDPVKENARQKWPDIHALRYKNGVRAGWNSQTGQIIQILLEVVTANVKNDSTAGKGEFVAAEFAEAMESFFENQLIPSATIDKNGKIDGLSGRFTNSEIRDNFNVWFNKGAKDGPWWNSNQIASTANTSDGSQFGVILAALYRDPWDLIPKAFEFVRMIYSDPAYIQSHVMYILTVQALINGVPLETLLGYFQAINYQRAEGYAENKFIDYDEMHTPHNAINMLKKPHLFPFPDDRFITLMFGGLDCHVKHLQPAAYYLSYKYCQDFEKGILTAINGIGNNMACATMVGGLIGAMVGINGIPERFIKGLKNDQSMIPKGFKSQADYLLDLSQAVADGSNGRIPEYSHTAPVIVE